MGENIEMISMVTTLHILPWDAIHASCRRLTFSTILYSMLCGEFICSETFIMHKTLDMQHEHA